MKKFIIYLFAAVVAVVTVSACGAARMTTAEKAQIEQAVEDNLAAKDYTILIQLMIPARGSSRAVSNYSVRVSGDTLVSYLPYFGEARNLPYGGGKGLDFTARIGQYRDIPTADGGHEVNIRLSNDEDVFQYTILVSRSGSAFVTVSSRNRETISYTGEMYLP